MRLMIILARVFIALLPAAVPAAVASAQSDPVRLYGEAMARETAVRADLSNPAARDTVATKRRLRTLVGAYADLARLFPASGVGDKALWQGGMLAADAFWQWSEPVDRATALRVFQALRTTYPVSTLTRQSQTHVKRLGDAPVAETAVARVPAPPAAAQPAPATPAVPPPPPVPVPAPVPPPAATTATALLTAIRHEALAGVMRVTLDVDRETSFRGERLDNPSRVFVDLQQTRTQEQLRDAVISVTRGGLQRIRVGRHPGGLTRVVLDLSGPRRYSVYSLYNPYRVVIDVEGPPGPASLAPAAPTGPTPVAARTMVPRRPVALSWPAARAQSVSASVGDLPEGPAVTAAAATLPPLVSEPIIVPAAAESVAGSTLPAPAAAAATARGDYSLSRQLGLGIARIVIDAGHGGHDPG